MAAPTAPDIDSIATEALKRAGYSSPSDAQITRAQDEWMQEIKSDIWLIGKRLKPLMAEHIEILNGGQSRYNFPSDFSSIHDAEILYGDEVDDVEGGAASTVILDSSDEDEGEEEIEGREIVIYSGTGKGEVSQCKSYNTSTYVATVSPAWGTQPVAGDTYFLVDQQTPLEMRTVDHFNQIMVPDLPGTPKFLYQVGTDNDYGYYHLYPTPHEDYYYAARINYFVNLRTLDLASDRMTMLYDRWRSLWIQGIKARQWEDDDDNRAPAAMNLYYQMVRDITRADTYGRNIKTTYTKIGA